MTTRELLAGLATAGILAGCSPALTVPPLTTAPTGEQHIGKFVWYDLLTDDVAGVRSFYGELLGWEFGGSDDAPYLVVRLGGQPIAGVARAARVEGGPIVNQWISTMSVADVDAAVGTAVARGGAVVRAPRNLEARGRFAAITDPQGALLALAASPTGDPPDGEPPVGAWLWTELWTTHPAEAVAFYRAIAGYSAEASLGGVGRPYQTLNRDGRARAGVLQIDPAGGVPPHWLPYVRVADAPATAARAEQLGGRVIIPPSPELRNGSVALIADPSGAAVVIQQWPIPGEEGGRRP
jgi:predicted enzyme related to lactoylglutathione lyase